ncbi:MAG: hypothetical protein ACD_79C00107G0002 [uncultured bacterium]|nr:MAG: hypothetical protein ACD_79C00107G0002 [uncultured bacterium]HBR71196.1 IS21 family transposase [Candidatus Moranbacteria bacterium]
MITFHEYSQIHYYTKEIKLTIPQIAEKIGLSEQTIKKWLSENNYAARRSRITASKLDPFKNQIQAMLEKYPLSAVQIFQKIKPLGYIGGQTILREYISKIRPAQKSAYLTLSFAPGECAQVDWGVYKTVQVGNVKKRLYFFVMVLCYSRMMYVEFTLSAKMEFFLGCHQNAFYYFGGIPQKIMIDNLKTGVLRHDFGCPAVFNKTYLDFANHYGFKPVACNSGKGNEKGRVENGVGYIKKNFLNGLEISDYKIINPLGKEWLENIANVRIHGETRKKPVELFSREKESLIALNLNPYDTGQNQIVRANHQFRVRFEGNKYSVPYIYAGINVIMKRYMDRLIFFYDNQIICEHVRSFENNRDIENPDHGKALLEHKKRAKEQKIYLRFMNLSKKSEYFYKKLEERRLNPNVHIRKIVALSEIYGKEAVERVIEDAIEFEAFSSEYIANLLEQRERAKKFNESGALHLTRREDLLELELEEPDLNIY